MLSERDFSPVWIKLFKRIHQLAKTQHVSRSKIIKLAVIVDASGTPLWWPDPECKAISPEGDGVKEWLNQL